MKSTRNLIMVLSAAAVVALVFFGAQLQIPTAFAFPILHFSKVHAVPSLTNTHSWTLGTNACAGGTCHVSTGSPGSATVTGLPSGGYKVGSTTAIPLTVTINDTTAGGFFGYELTARFSDGTQAGTWAAGTGSNLGTDVVPVVQGLGGSSTFGANWTPPSSAGPGTGVVTFYLSALAGSFPSADLYVAAPTLSAAAPPPPADFSLAGSTASLTATQGNTTSADTITVNGSNGFSGSVTLSTSTLPSGVTASFGTNPTTGTSALTFSASSTAATGTSTVTITGTSGSLSHTATVSLTVNAPPNFSLAGSATTLTATQGGSSGADTITVTRQNGFTGMVTLSTSTLPSGVTATFGTNPTTSTSSVTFAASSTATTGTNTITITGTSGSLSHTVMVSLTVNAPAPAPNFGLSGSASSLTVAQGGSSSADTITVTPQNGFAGMVTLSTSTLPSGVTATFGTNPATSTSSLTFAASSTATTGTNTITITGTSGSLSHTVTVSLTVNAAAPASSISATPSILTFNYQQGSTAPGSQPIMVSGSPTGLAYTAAASGASWLSIDSTSGKVPGMINATATPGTLPPGTYTGGKVTITATGATGSPQVVNVTLVVTASTGTSSLSATPNSLNFTYQLGGTAPSAQTLKVGTTGGAPLNFTASYSGNAWVKLSPTSGTTPGSISVSISLPRRGVTVGTYNGEINISGTGVTSINVLVTLTITSGSGGGGTTGAMYAQPYVYDTTSSGAVSAQWVNRLGDSTQYNNPGLVLSVSASAPAGSWAGAHILNVTGPLTEIGYDYRGGSECTTTSPRFMVVTTDAVTHIVGGCSVAGAQVQADTPVKGWTRVRFNLADPTQTNPVITPGMQVQSITLVMDQGPGSAPGASGGLAVIDSIDVNGTLITSGSTSYDD